jgi:RNA polymerase sigma-70 factor (ECF subfamily)
VEVRTAEPPTVERPAFANVFAAELPYVLRSLRRLGALPADVEDLGHDVFMVVHRELARFDPARPIRPWLFGIAFRVASDHRRLARVRLEVPTAQVPDAAALAESAEAHLERADDRALVLAALAALDLERRAVIVMHDLDGFSAPQVAAELGIPLNTAYSRLRLAREDLRRAVQRIRARSPKP